MVNKRIFLKCLNCMSRTFFFVFTVPSGVQPGSVWGWKEGAGGSSPPGSPSRRRDLVSQSLKGSQLPFLRWGRMHSSSQAGLFAAALDWGPRESSAVWGHASQPPQIQTKTLSYPSKAPRWPHTVPPRPLAPFPPAVWGLGWGIYFCYLTEICLEGKVSKQAYVAQALQPGDKFSAALALPWGSSCVWFLRKPTLLFRSWKASKLL